MDFAVNRNHAHCGDVALQDAAAAGSQIDATGEIDLCEMNKSNLCEPGCAFGYFDTGVRRFVSAMGGKVPLKSLPRYD
jgi:hypothetical protein